MAKINKTAMLNVRLKPATRAFVEREASERGVSVGTLVETWFSAAAARASGIEPRRADIFTPDTEAAAA